MKNYVLFVILAVMTGSIHARNYSLQSPSGRLSVTVDVDDIIQYTVSMGEQVIISPSPIALKLEDEVLGRNAKVRRNRVISVDEEITPVVARKNSLIPDAYNQLTLTFRGYNLHFRAYDEGIAYRWEVTRDNQWKVMTEQATFTFPDDYQVWFPEEESMFTHQERSYLNVKLSEITASRFASTGLLVDCGNNINVYISESDLVTDYAGMYLRGSEEVPFRLEGKFAGVVLEEK